MKRDVVNGYEWLIFQESEKEEAYTAEYAGHPRVLIATTCVECHGPIETRLHNGRPRHTENYHESLRR